MKDDCANVSAPDDGNGCDNVLALCSVTDKADTRIRVAITLPRWARVPINRCNLPAVILGGLTFNAHPAALALDGVHALHRALFSMLDHMDETAVRAQGFMHYMARHFRPEQSDQSAPACPRDGDTAAPSRPLASPARTASPRDRTRATYLRVVRGWLFDPDGREAAVLKGWVESRFGLTPRHHGEPLRDPGSPAYAQYLEDRAAGLYGTNALEEQLDLLYTYCQYELRRQSGTRAHRTLFRGVNRMHAHERLAVLDRKHEVLLLNNLNSFTSSRERAGEFGDYILCTEVPLSKIVFFSGLLPGMPQGEEEYVVIGGLYEVGFATL
jgi:NAD+--dinitrogen-reductase ADP-D-ribosyltransferase